MALLITALEQNWQTDYVNLLYLAYTPLSFNILK